MLEARHTEQYSTTQINNMWDLKAADDSIAKFSAPT